MTGLRRLPIIAIAALLAAGCGANVPIPGPTAAARHIGYFDPMAVDVEIGGGA